MHKYSKKVISRVIAVVPPGMNFSRLSYLALGLMALYFGYAFWHIFAFPDASWQLDKGDRVVLASREQLTQPFVATRDGLRRVEVLFGDFSLTGNDTLTVELRDNTCINTLAKKTFAHEDFSSEYTRSFVFDRIPDSQEKTYCLAISFQSDQDVSKTKRPRFFIDRSAHGTPYAITSDEATETKRGAQPIAIRPGYTDASFVANAHEFFDRISQYKPFFLKTAALAPLTFFGLFLTFLTAFLLMREEE